MIIKENNFIFSGAVSENILTLTLTGTENYAEIFDANNPKFQIFSEEFFGILGISDKKIANFDEKSFENYTKIILPEYGNTNEDEENNENSGSKESNS